MRQLFSVPKVGVFCDGIAHRIERRKDGDVKVVDLSLGIQPFTAQHAAALDQDDYGFVKRVLFKLNTGDPVTDLQSVQFKASKDSQKLIVFAAPDTTEPSIAFDQVKLTRFRARVEKGVDGWGLVLGVTFGPVSRTELEYVNGWYTEQRFVTFEEGEPFLDFQSDEPPARATAEPTFDDVDSEATADAKRSVETSRAPMRRHRDRKSAAKAKQKAARETVEA